jgi:hypothetical protein
VTIDEARQRVERGAALLDRKKPGWREKVNPETLEMWVGCSCVLGQVFGDFFRGLVLLALDYHEDEEDVRHGFDIDYAAVRLDGLDVLDQADYDLLQDAWLEQLGAKS